MLARLTAAVLGLCLIGCRHAVVEPATAPAALADSLPHIDVPHCTFRPQITAEVDDPAWADAATITDLKPSLGTSRRTRSQPTTIRLLWDEDHLYFRFICDDDEIYVPFEGNQRDRDYYQGDVVELFLDVVGDQRQWYEVQVTPANQVFDQALLLTAEPRWSKNGRLLVDILKRDLWPVPGIDLEGLKTAASRSPDAQRWIVDMAVPAKAVLKRLGRETYAPMTLRANLMRYDWQLVDGQRVLHPLNWSVVEFGRPHQSPAAMGYLRLVK